MHIGFGFFLVFIYNNSSSGSVAMEICWLATLTEEEKTGGKGTRCQIILMFRLHDNQEGCIPCASKHDSNSTRFQHLVMRIESFLKSLLKQTN